MDGDLLTAVRGFLEMGWPAIVLGACWVLWRAYQVRTDQYIEALREIAGLKAQLPRVDALSAQPGPIRRPSRAEVLKRRKPPTY